MTDTLISFETAKLAKQKGFDLKTKHWYDQVGGLNPRKGASGSMVYDNVGYSPSQSLLQRCLREVHNIDVIVYPLEAYINNKSREQERQDIEYFHMIFIKGVKRYMGGNPVASYEEALEVGLEEGLKQI